MNIKIKRRPAAGAQTAFEGTLNGNQSRTVALGKNSFTTLYSSSFASRRG